MKIVMLGHSGAGKTTYLALMYFEMQEDIGGFRVRAKDPQHHQQLLQDAQAIRVSRYPAPTHQRASYDLALSYNGSEVLPFTWRDHRGGAASGRTSDEQDVAALHQDLLESDAIVVFVDGAELATNARAARMVGRLNGHVLRALRAREDVLTPLVVAVTKCDLIDLENTRVVDAIFAPFMELTSAVTASEHIHGMLLPISCGPSPMNVIIPVLWSLRFGVVGMVMRLAATVEQEKNAAAVAASRDTFGDRVSSWFKNEPTWASIAAHHWRAAEAAYQEFKVLVPPAERLDDLLSDVESF